MTNSEFLKQLADKIERLPTMFSEEEVKRLREIANPKWQTPLSLLERKRLGLS